MAQSLVNVIKSNRQPKELKPGLIELPQVKQTDLQPKSLIVKKEEKSRVRAGRPQMSINPYGKPKIIEDGKKIK